MSLTISIDLKKLYKQLCPECRKKLEEMVREQITEQLVKQALEQ